MNNNTQYNIMNILVVILLSLLLTNCSYETKKHPIDNKLSNYSIADSLWISFRDALVTKKLDYLISMSFDSIKCVDCLPDSLKTSDEIYDSKFIYRSHLKDLIHLDNLNDFEYSTYQNDSIIYVSYTIKWKKAEENNYGLHYQFKK